MTSENEMKILANRKNQMRAAKDETRNRSNVLKELMRAQELGKLSGIHGRLGDLGMINAKYDIAISTAAFGPLNYILVNQTGDAEAILNYLREH